LDKLAPLLQAIASLGWVVFAFVAIFVFKRQLTTAFGRLKRGKFFGQEFELDNELVGLEISASALESEVRELPVVATETEITTQNEELDAKFRPILQQAATAPKVALMMLSAELDKLAIHGVATRGLLRGRRAVSLKQALSELQQYGLPAAVESSIELFNSVRDRIIHGVDVSKDDALRALDSGMTILRALSALPSETYVVYKTGINLFADRDCTKPIVDARGILFDVTSPDGTKRNLILPTTRTHFEIGKQVAWEWNMDKSWPAAWYRDSDTNEIKMAWGGATEFVGRHLDDITG